jgi:hypothetical protein
MANHHFRRRKNVAVGVSSMSRLPISYSSFPGFRRSNQRQPSRTRAGAPVTSQPDATAAWLFNG